MNKKQKQALLDSCVSKLSLHNICLTNSQFELDEENIIHPGLQKEKIAGLSIGGISISVTEVTPRNQDDITIYLFAYTLVVSLKNEDESISFATLKATMQAAYRATQTLSADEQQIFGQLNSIVHVWPYIRQYVQSTFQNAGFQSIVLPMSQPHIETADDITQCQ